jgi:LuxR family transcriptional regulator, maltose regulon positive regulatory protein
MERVKRTPIAPTKISSPRIAKTYARTRLFKCLDANRHRPLVWISAPAGAGKTTLAAGYLNARKLKFLWYQFDGRDTDPAAFFFYLREAVKRTYPRRRENLPLLTPEYLAGLPTFARNFFEVLYTRMRAPSVLVFDNFQDLPEKCITQQLLEPAMSIIPEGIRVIFLSRTGPPPALARFRIEQTMQFLDAKTLELTLPEARGIARLQNGAKLDFKRLDGLHQKIRGWTAGWILLLTHERRSGTRAPGFPREARDTVFQYFATELFDRAAPAVQELLLKTSLLPEIAVSTAVTLTGIIDAAAIFEDLERNNYFITRLITEEPVYQFHPLFHAFLRDRLVRDLPLIELRSLQCRAAVLLCERGHYDEAAALMMEYQDEPGLTQLVLSQAAVLTQQGRFGTLETWLRALHSRTLESNPWIAYWMGTCLMVSDLTEARAHLERAFALFKEQSDFLGQYSAWAGIVESYYYQWDLLTQIDRWFEELQSLQRYCSLTRWPDVEVRVVYAVVSVLGFAGADRHNIDAWVERARTLWNSRRDLRVRGLMMASLGLYYFWKADAVKLRSLLGELRQIITAETMDPLVRLQAHWILACQWIIGDLQESVVWVQRALAFSERIGVRIFEGFFLSCGAANCQILDDMAGAERYTERLRQTLQPERRLDHSLCLYHESWLARRRGDNRGSAGLLEEALDIAHTSDASHARAVIQVALAESLTPLGDTTRATELIRAAQKYAADSDNAMLMFICLLGLAWDALRNHGEALCAPRLREAFAHGREHAFSIYPCWLAPKMSELCGVALRHDIESDYAARLIRLRHLMPDGASAFQAEWPFPVKIHALGRFVVVVDNEPLTFSGKAPKRPLELLQGLIAFSGRRVSEGALAMALWPQAGDPLQALATTLHRLRKLIGEETIDRQDGHLSLNTRRVWIDVWAVEQALVAVGTACRLKDLDMIGKATENLTALYEGDFLAGESAAPWAVPLRDRLRSRLVQQLDSAASVMMQAGNLSDACALYHRALQCGPVAESLHYGLMRCYQDLGRSADALIAYDQCRSMLRDHLGVLPSARTEKLARQLRGE